MNSLHFYKNHFTKIYVLPELASHPAVQRVRSVLNHIPCIIVGSKEDIPGKDQHLQTLFFNYPKAAVVGRCPGSRGHICCNYLTIDLYVGCTIGCTYCIMKSYLNFSPVTVNLNYEKSIKILLKWAEKNPNSYLRVGTGEVGDSLLYDPLLRLSEHFIHAFAEVKNIYFELKTKTDFIDHLLDIKNKGNTVFGFSLNPPTIAQTEEPKAVSLDKRIAAAKKAAQAGFNIAFHFDPVFRFPGWKKAYSEVINKLSSIPKEKILWISLGTFRYTLKLREKIDSRWFLYEEYIPCKDKKYRYIQKVRKDMYKFMLFRIRNIYPDAPVYMCMESPAMWQQVFGKKPKKIDNLCIIFKTVKI